MNQHNMCEFQIIDWYSKDAVDDTTDDGEESANSDESSEDGYKPKFQKDNSKFKIYVFGKDVQERTITLEITDFTPYFYIKLPDCDPSHDKRSITVLKRFIKDGLWAKYKHCLLGVSILYKHSFRNFDNMKKYRFARFKFSNLSLRLRTR